MRVTGEGVWGEPDDRDEALRVLKRLPELGVNFIDTADSYGPYVSEDLLREALHPYDGLVDRYQRWPDPARSRRVAPSGPPRIPAAVCADEPATFGSSRPSTSGSSTVSTPKWSATSSSAVIAEMQKEGLIRHVGLSEVSVEEIGAAQKHFKVASVQNLYNLVTRQSEDVLDYCEAENIGFIPWFPLAAGTLAREGSVMDSVTKKLDASPSQVALAWVLKRSPVMLPIPGTSKVSHLEENVAAAGLELSDEDFRALDEVGRQESERQQQDAA